MEPFLVVCRKGAIVREPLTGVIISDEAPSIVENNTYWRRRLKAGDILLYKENVEVKKEKV